MSKRTQALAAMELEGPAASLVADRVGRRPGRLSLDRMRPNPDQPRRSLDATAVLQLAADIQSRGLLQPIVVGPPDADGIHTIIAGERRWRACRKADLEVAEVVIDYGLTSPDDMFDSALAENIQREDLSRPDLAAAMLRVRQRTGATDEQLAERYSKSLEWIRHVLAFAALPVESQDFMEAHRIPTALARAIRPLPEANQLEVLRALEPLDNRQQQIARVGQVKDLLREGVAVTEALSAVALPGRPGPANGSVASPPTRRPRGLSSPFEWNGDSLYVNIRALAQLRVAPSREGMFERWVDALVDDLSRVRELCAGVPEGDTVWNSVRESLRPLLNED